MEFKNLEKEILDEEHLSVLRALGRAIGVKAPASKKKEVLVKEIIEINQGVLEPNLPTNKGAPPKMDVDLSKYICLTEFDPYPTVNEYEKIYLHDSGSDTHFVETGILEIHQSGYGFIRTTDKAKSRKDIYVSEENIRKFNLREGDKIKAFSKVGNKKESPALIEPYAINDIPFRDIITRKNFDDLTPCYPNSKFKLETKFSPLAIRCIDIFAPIGKGQRALVVAPPKTGKTTLIKQIARSIEENHPEAELFVLLIDERPEEVTDIKNFTSAEVISSTFDEGYEHHVKVAEKLITRAKRYAEAGKDVVILLDSITRLARAYNNVIPSSGKTLSGGIDPVALQGPKRLFGVARNLEYSGSVTIIATALVETESRMDDVIYEEFKGTGNMEIHLSRELSEKRIFPAIDLFKSGTRNDNLLLTEKEFSSANKLRRILSERNDATDILLDMIGKTSSNEDLLNKLDNWLKIYSK